MVIVADDKSDILDYYPVSFDKKANQIEIPVIVIGKTVGDALYKQLQSSNKDLAESLIMEFEVPLPEKDIVKMSLVLSAGDMNAYEFINNFSNVIRHLGDNFSFDTIYFSNSLVKEDIEIDSNSCLDKERKICLLTEENPKLYLSVQLYQVCVKESIESQMWVPWLRTYFNKCRKEKEADI